MIQIADKIKKHRTAKGLSQKEIALEISIDQAQYSRIENGKVEPTLSSLEKIADALNVSLTELFDDNIVLDINSYDKSAIDKLRLVDELEEEEKKSIFNIIDIAISRKRLKDNLIEALKV
ncbi:MAG: helix-turn-helix domain-containing protein [Bacteroidales bacterium]|jgi:transcriptional regulator with XRE-family HTH domain|nr:helix-turn-helix domain-containing protein [Bacteroidales bacterium]